MNKEEEKLLEKISGVPEDTDWFHGAFAMLVEASISIATLSDAEVAKDPLAKDFRENTRLALDQYVTSIKVKSSVISERERKLIALIEEAQQQWK